jgi:ubiquinone/menaquinone biosynthesis C-methylase UbiE
MKHEEAVSFIKMAITATESENWADLGCGSGIFTKALAELLPTGSHITAVDREKQNLNIPAVDFIKASFDKEALNLTGLDGILIANAIHYVADKTSLIKKLGMMFKENPKFLIIEYDTDKPNPWVPYPLSFKKLQILFQGLGYGQIDRISERPSAYHSYRMYCALITA